MIYTALRNANEIEKLMSICAPWHVASKSRSPSLSTRLAHRGQRRGLRVQLGGVGVAFIDCSISAAVLLVPVMSNRIHRFFGANMLSLSHQLNTIPSGSKVVQLLILTNN